MNLAKAIAISIILACAASVGQAGAQSVAQMDFQMQSTILAPQGIVKSCGIRFSGVAMVQGSNSEGLLVDGSIAIHAEGFAMVKAGYHFGSVTNLAAPLRPTGKHIKWLRIEGGIPLSPQAGGTIAGDAPGYDLYGVKIGPALDAIGAMLAQKTIWVGFGGGDGDHIFSGRIRPDPKVEEQIYSCIGELNLDTWKKGK